MTTFYVYGIVRPETGQNLQLDDGGIAGAPVSTVECDDIAAVVSPFDGERVRSSSANMWAHQRVVEEARLGGTVLPVRFGTLLPSERAVSAELLEPRRLELSLLLAEFAGKTEIRVKCTYLPDVALREAVAVSPRIQRIQAKIRNRPEAATFQARLQLGELAAGGLDDIRERDASLILGCLSRHATHSKVLGGSGHEVAVHAAFLLDGVDLDEFGDAVDEMAAANERRLKFELVGPLAPWDFADLGAVGEVGTEGRRGGR